jgi:hypothetical protein
MKIRPVGTEFFHEYGGTEEQTGTQTDMTKLIVALRNFAKVSKNWILIGRHMGGIIRRRDEGRVAVHPVINFVFVKG